MPDYAIIKRSDLEADHVVDAEYKLQLYFGNLYQKYVANPATLETSAREYLATIQAHVDNYLDQSPKDASTLVCLIKGEDWSVKAPSDTNAPRRVMEDQVFCIPYNDELQIVFAYSSKVSLNYLTNLQLKDLQTDAEALLASARDNLRRHHGGVSYDWNGPSVRLTTSAGLESGLLLLPEIWQELGANLDGEIVAMLPERNTLMATSTAHPASIELLARYAPDIYKAEPYRVSPELFVWRDGRWQVFRADR